MDIQLQKAIDQDAQDIFDIQVKAFKPLLEKYKDVHTNPANETIERVLERIHHPDGSFYKIVANRRLAGAICIVWKNDRRFRISPMFIHPDYQGKGIAQHAIRLTEELFPQAGSWELATILEEERNCYLYEKMGYSKTGVKKKLNEGATVVYYEKPGK
ncbi:GNAT family N-acetyltransferase [Bacillus marinisedimentorum]|uniref:GNAT family N-acetyltransferase n=1 Tax=Bacillus marinisedimentorum TaxID=1821260 RepID=UPI0007DF65A1|nr:GNAT family N-acetyltransferase [Bacillus marinisedimentorum]